MTDHQDRRPECLNPMPATTAVKMLGCPKTDRLRLVAQSVRKVLVAQSVRSLVLLMLPRMMTHQL